MPETQFRFSGDLPGAVRTLLVATDRISSIFALAHAVTGSKQAVLSAQVTRRKMQSTVNVGNFYQVGSVAIFVPSDSLQSDIAQNLAAYLLALIPIEHVVVLAALASELHQGHDHSGIRILSSSHGLAYESGSSQLESANVVSSLAAALLIEAELKGISLVCYVGLTDGQYLTEDNAGVWVGHQEKWGLKNVELGAGVLEVESRVYSSNLYL
mmetsp:Transcript_8062/g.15858  ORF Transcript_8062/g.15858 Transcript_8062/m.15858 type:complete len:212 (-) Transcript_8062:1505-2140(-)